MFFFWDRGIGQFVLVVIDFLCSSRFFLLAYLRRREGPDFFCFFYGVWLSWISFRRFRTIVLARMCRFLTFQHIRHCLFEMFVWGVAVRNVHVRCYDLMSVFFRAVSVWRLSDWNFKQGLSSNPGEGGRKFSPSLFSGHRRDGYLTYMRLHIFYK